MRGGRSSGRGGGGSRGLGGGHPGGLHVLYPFDADGELGVLEVAAATRVVFDAPLVGRCSCFFCFGGGAQCLFRVRSFCSTPKHFWDSIQGVVRIGEAAVGRAWSIRRMTWTSKHASFRLLRCTHAGRKNVKASHSVVC